MFKRTRTYHKWASMWQRCTNPNHERYKYYGGRGIKVHSRWREFKHFLADMGEAPPGLWLDRIDNSKHYEPGNCRWVTPRESANNKRQRATVPGTLKDKARIAGLPYHVVYYRVMRAYWPIDKALSTPVRVR